MTTKTETPRTMDDAYGDGSDHLICEECGMCAECGDCRFSCPFLPED